jgi:hypothetical protein
MSYEDLEKAKAERAAKETAKEAKKAEREARKAAKEAKEETPGKSIRGRKRKSPADADMPEPKAKVAQISGTQVADNKTAPTRWKAPVARMW